MDLKLSQKVFIVTGGSKGIGKAITRTLAAEKAIPVIASRSAAPNREVVSSIRAEGGEASSIEVDLGSIESSRKVIETTLERYGRLDGIVNNAGFNDGIGLESGSPEAFRESMVYNLFHYYDLVHFALPHLKAAKGSIVNISSKVAFTGQGNTSAYAASKGAQLALTREWAAELAGYGIRVNAVLPAEVMTPLYRKWLDTSFADPQEEEKKISSRIPLGNRMTLDSEIADTTVFLLSGRSGHTTGQLLVVDGGYVHLDRALTS